MAKVNERSTKGELWRAYQELLGQLQNEPVAIAENPSQLGGITKDLSDVKLSLGHELDKATERLGKIAEAYRQADQELGQRKAAVVQAVEAMKRQVEDSIKAVKKQREQEDADKALERQREAEEYRYNLNRQRREEEEQYSVKLKAREQQLDNRETVLSEQEKQLAELKKQVEAFPQQLIEAEKTAREETAKNLTAEHNTLVKELKQDHQYQKGMLELKLQTAESDIASQQKQLAELKQQLDKNSQQLKDMAVTVIQAGNAGVQSSAAPKPTDG